MSDSEDRPRLGRLSKMTYPQLVSYHLAGLGADPPSDASLPPDVAPTLVAEVTKPVERQRGWVAVPTYDMRQYVQTQFITFAAGFVVGMGIGALFGNIIAGKNLPVVGKIAKNRHRSSRRRRRVRRNSRRKSPRRTSTRKRKRGRPTVKPVGSYEDWVKLPNGFVHVVVRAGKVYASRPHAKITTDSPEFTRVPIGTVYDTGTKFRSVPREWDAEVREFGTLAGAVKHIVRAAERAA
jgi:hypothetical protein